MTKGQGTMASAPRTVVTLMVAGISVLLARPALAQIDLAGEWGLKQHEDAPSRGAGPAIGEYEGLPINDAARMKAESWDAAVYAIPERQCIPLPADLITVSNLRIWKEVDPSSQQTVAWRTHSEWAATERTIWMDGRLHPSENAPHTWQGFATGKWDGNILTVTTTHLKYSFIQRNGVPGSSKRTLTERFIRHGNYLTILQITTDPVYLTEPLWVSRDYVWNPGQTMNGYECTPAPETSVRKQGYVPHYLPGKNPFLDNPWVLFKLPAFASRGGAETMYPEFMMKLKDAPGRPPVTK
jgi:hypothetical protein